MTDYSQWGEQSLIAAILAKLPNLNRWCVDVGAGDGVTGSNTRALIENGYNAILFEADYSKCALLEKSARALPDGPTVIPIRVAVKSIGTDSLDELLFMSDVPSRIDFLSIDIDSNDYHIWASLKNYYPKLVCIEFNATIPEFIHAVQPDVQEPIFGASLLALVELGKEKGYELAGVTVTNALFVRNDLYPILGIADNSIAALWTNRCFMSYVFYGYSGQRYIAGYPECPWTVKPRVEAVA